MAKLTVNTDADNGGMAGELTLREAIEAINTGSTAALIDGEIAQVDLTEGFGVNDTIEFAPGLSGMTITLGGSQLTIMAGLTIDGDIDNDGTADITVDADDMSRVMEITAGTSLIDGLILTNGVGGARGGGAQIGAAANVTFLNSSITDSDATNYGGGLDNRGTLTLRGSTVSGNYSADYAGGIYNDGTLTLDGATLLGNSTNGPGGGLYNVGGTATLIGTTVSGNTAGGSGGGLYNSGSGTTLTVINSTITGNTGGDGGGLFNTDMASATLINTTLSGNSSSGFGGGIRNNASGTIALTNSTISGNYAGYDGGGLNNGATATLTNTLVLGNDADDLGDEIQGAYTDGGGNLVGGAALADVFNEVHSHPNTGVLGGRLRDNGGPVQTIKLKPATQNPALDTGYGALPADPFDLDGDMNMAEPLPVDARGPGFFRDVEIPGVGGTPDVGAYELQGPVFDTPSLVVTERFDTVDITDGEITLREAIGWINDGTFPAGSTITFDTGPGGEFSTDDDPTITLRNGELVITEAMTIDGDLDGDGSRLVEVERGGSEPNHRIFNIADPDADTELRGLIVTNGRTTGDNANASDDTHSGGGIYSLADLTLVRSEVSGNSTTGDYARGGGVFGSQEVTLVESVIRNNSTSGEDARGGGVSAFRVDADASIIDNNGTTGLTSDAGGIHAGLVTISNSAVTNNSTFTSFAGGGGISASTVRIYNSTISGNSTAGDNSSGGGVLAGFLTLTNATIQGNSTAGSGADGGGVNAPSLTVQNSTVTGNSVADPAALGGGIYTGMLTLDNSIVTGNADNMLTISANIHAPGPNVFGGVNIIGNYVDSGGPPTMTTPADVFAATVETLLDINGDGTPETPTGVFGGALGLNGGIGQTALLKIDPSNPALDTGTAPLPTDVRDLDGDLNFGEPLPVDARGLPRDVDLPGIGMTPDLGAVEIQSLPPAAPLDLVVTTLLDERDGGPDSTLAQLSAGTGLSLREALAIANQNPATHDVIRFAGDAMAAPATLLDKFGNDVTGFGGYSELTVNDGGAFGSGYSLDITGNVTIDGDLNDDGHADIILLGGDNDAFQNPVINEGLEMRLFTIDSDQPLTVVLEGLGIKDGKLDDETPDLPGYRAGAGIFVGTDTALTFKNGFIVDNRTDSNSFYAYGAAIYAEDNTDLVIDNTFIGGNDARRDGGGIYSGGPNSTLIITDSVFTSNETSQRGGAVHFAGSQFSIANSTFTGNEADALGGSLSISGNAVATIAKTAFSNNQASNAGAVSGIESAALEIVNSSFTFNSAASNGGGINWLSDEPLNIVNGTFAGNVAGFNGGGLYSQEDIQVTIDSSTFTGNYAEFDGGGIFTLDGNVDFTNSILLGSYAAVGQDLVIGGTATYETTIIGNMLYDSSQGVNPSAIAANTNAAAALVFEETTGFIDFNRNGVEDGSDQSLGGTLAGVVRENGGPVPTVMLHPGVANPALDGAVPIALALDEMEFGTDLDGDGMADDVVVLLSLDARGVLRPFDGDSNGIAVSDLGAVERINDAVQASTAFTVTTADDELDNIAAEATLADFGGAGDLSLREAVVLANRAPTPATIVFDPTVFDGEVGDLIRLTMGEIRIQQDLTISEATATDVTITGDALGNDPLRTGVLTDAEAGFFQNRLLDNSRIFHTDDDLFLFGLTLTGGHINYHSLHGGGAAYVKGDLSLYETTFDGNAFGLIRERGLSDRWNAFDQSTSGGGAAWVGGTLTVDQSEFSHNLASFGRDGAGAVVNDGELIVRDSTFLYNMNADDGGVFYAVNGDVTIINSLFDHNRIADVENRFGGSDAGGAVYAQEGNILAANSIFTNGYGQDEAGAIYANYGDLTIVSSYIAGNMAGDEGGAVYTNESSSTLLVINSIFVNNFASVDNTDTAGDEGGAIYGTGAVTVINSTIANNQTDDFELNASTAEGGGIYSDGPFLLVNSTVTGNGIANAAEGGGIYVSDDATLVDSIVTGNTAQGGPGDEIFLTGTLTLIGGNVLGDELTQDGAFVQNVTPAEIFAGTETVMLDTDSDEILDFDTGVVTGALADNGGRGQTVALNPSLSNPVLDIASNFAINLDEATIGADLNSDGDMVDFIATVADLQFDSRGPNFLRDMDQPGGGTPDLGGFELPETNVAPVINDDAFSVFEDGPPVMFELTTNDVDENLVLGGNVEIVALDLTGTLGLVTVNPDGDLVEYDPNGMFEHLADGEEGTDTFEYTGSDGEFSGTATVTVTILGENDPPEAVADMAMVLTDDAPVEIDLVANDIDPDNGAMLSVIAIDIFGLEGSAAVNGAMTGVVFDPAGAFPGLGAGEMAETMLTYLVSDGLGGTDLGTLTVKITGGADRINAAPTANPDTGATGAGGPTVLIDLTGNDTDPEGDPLTVTGLAGGLGSAVISGDGQGLIYNPDGAFDGLGEGETAEDVITYTLSDGKGGTDTASVTITVTGEEGQPPPNQAPVAQDDSFDTAADTTAMGNVLADNGLGADSDPDGDVLQVAPQAATLPSGALLTLNGNGAFTYDPADAFDFLNEGETAEDNFTYLLSDGRGGTDTATATITITGVAEEGLLEGDEGDNTFDISDFDMPLTIDGMGGTDTVTLPGNLDDFLIEPIEGGFRFTPLAGGAPIDLLDIEFIELDDTTLFRDESAEARQTDLIYQVFLGRMPDGPGLAFWVDIAQNVLPLDDVVDFFPVSPEFEASFGTDLTNKEFVEVIYQNGLDREGDAAGCAFWTDLLDTGALDRGGVGLAFALSDEVQMRFENEIDDGLLIAV